MKNTAVRMILVAVNTALKAMTVVKLGRNEQPNAPNRLPLKHSRKPILVLEQRIVFDGAAGVDVTHAVTDQSHAMTDSAPVSPPIQVSAAEPAKDNGKKEVVFIDTSVADYQTLIDGVRPGVEIELIDGAKNGLDQIAMWAETHTGYDAIHILSHGSEGQVNLGTALLDDATLQSSTVQAELAGIRHALNSGGDLLLYGCEVGAGADGQRFIDELAAITGADVAASTNATGAADKGGDWTLEAKSGSVEARELAIDAYHDLLVTVTIDDNDADYSSSSFTKTVGGRTFTFSDTSNALGMDTSYGAGTPGLYAYEGTVNGSDIKLTISIENGYTFDVSSFMVGTTTGNLSIKLTYANGSTETFSQTGLSDSWQTLSSFNSVSGMISDVKPVAAAPTVTDAKISITSTGSGTGGAYKIGDVVTASWNNTGIGDNNAGITGVTMNFSAFGGGAAVTATNSSGTWTGSYTIVSGSIDGTNKNVSVRATTAGGTTTEAATTNLTVDNIAPTVTDAKISISGASGTGGAYKIGDTVTASWNNTASGDNNSDTISGVRVDFSQFGGGAAVAATNSAGTWTAAYTIESGAIDGSNKNVSITATDNAGNTKTTDDTNKTTKNTIEPTNTKNTKTNNDGNTTTTADTSNATVDNVAPTTSIATMSFSADTGRSSSDFITKTAAQTISGTTSAYIVSGEIVEVSLDNGSTWTTATTSVGSNTWSLSGQTLTSSN